MNNTEQQIAVLMQQVLVMTQELKELKERLPKPGLVWVGTKDFSEQIDPWRLCPGEPAERADARRDGPPAAD